MFRSNRVLLILVCFLVLFTCCFAAPTRFTRTTLVRRQNGPSDGPHTITTTNQIPTLAGMFTQTCTIVMTPITGPDGASLIREEKTCTMSLDGGGSSSTLITRTIPGPSITPTSSSVPGGGSGPGPTPLPLSSGNSIFTYHPSYVSQGSSSPSPTLSGGLSILNQPSPSPSGSDTLIPSSSSSPDGTAVGAAADTTPTPTSFVPPGKTLQVLPIGLGVFAGVSVVAIIIVGYVTYERMKHRRNFRNQKLADTGAEMGSSGMARP